MDVTRYKCPRHLSYRLNNSLIILRPLAPLEISSAEQTARLYYRENKYAELERMIQIIATSASVHPSQVRRCTPASVEACYRAWLSVHNSSVPDCEMLREYLGYAIWIDDDVAYDGLAAYHSTGASDFYGEPVGNLTSGQLVYFLYVKNAYASKVESDKKVTKTWLQKMEQKWKNKQAAAAGKQ